MYLALTVRVGVLPDPGWAITRDGTSSVMNRLGIDSVVRFKFQTRSSLFETFDPPFNLSSFEQRSSFLLSSSSNAGSTVRRMLFTSLVMGIFLSFRRR